MTTLNAEELCDIIANLARSSGLGFHARKKIQVTIEDEKIVLRAHVGKETHEIKIEVPTK
jgi:hypothetical protein